MKRNYQLQPGVTRSSSVWHATDNNVVDAPDNNVVDAPDNNVVDEPDNNVVDAPDKNVVDAPDNDDVELGQLLVTQTHVQIPTAPHCLEPCFRDTRVGGCQP